MGLKNVVASDGTVIFTYGKLSTGSALTNKLAKKRNRQCLHIKFDTEKKPVKKINNWLIDWEIRVINLAGRSASKAPEICDAVKDIIVGILREQNGGRLAT